MTRKIEMVISEEMILDDYGVQAVVGRFLERVGLEPSAVIVVTYDELMSRTRLEAYTDFDEGYGVGKILRGAIRRMVRLRADGGG